MDTHSESAFVDEFPWPGNIGNVIDPKTAILVAVRYEVPDLWDQRLRNAEIGGKFGVGWGATKFACQVGLRLVDLFTTAQCMSIVLLDIHDHHVAANSNLVGMRLVVFQHKRGNYLGPQRAADIDDAGSERRIHMADEGVVPADGNLSPAWEIDVR